MHLLRTRWEQAPPPQRRRIVCGGLALVCTSWLFLLLAVGSTSERSAQRLAAAMRRYGEVQDLAREYLAGKAVASPLAALPPLQAVQQVAAALGIESRLQNMRPGQLNEVDTVELTFTQFDLETLLLFLQRTEGEAGLKVASCTLERPEQGENLASLQLVLIR